MDSGYPKLEDFPLITYDKIRFADTDKQGHVNNGVFSTFLDTGRSEFLYDQENPFNTPLTSFVLARQEIDLIGEIYWPGNVDIGTAVVKIGTSSMTTNQALYQNGVIKARALGIIVQVSNETKRSEPFTDDIRKRLEALLISAPEA